MKSVLKVWKEFRDQLATADTVFQNISLGITLGMGAATKRIRGSQVITVDGSAGVVTLPKSAEMENRDDTYPKCIARAKTRVKRGSVASSM